MHSSPEGVRFRTAGAAAGAGMVLMHLVLGWAWTPLGAALGVFIGRGGVLAGATGGLVAWLAIAGWSLSVDPHAGQEMMRVVGAILGGLPGWSVLAATALLGALLGAAGGWIGSSVRNLLRAVGR